MRRGTDSAPAGNIVAFQEELGRGDDLRIEGIPNGRQIKFKADFWRVGFGRRSTSG